MCLLMQCGICHKEYQSDGWFRRHVRKAHPEYDEQEIYLEQRREQELEWAIREEERLNELAPLFQRRYWVFEEIDSCEGYYRYCYISPMCEMKRSYDTITEMELVGVNCEHVFDSQNKVFIVPGSPTWKAELA